MRYWWAIGMIGTVTPTSFATSGAAMPAASTTTSVSISPLSVTTRQTRPRASRSIAVTCVRVLISAP